MCVRRGSARPLRFQRRQIAILGIRVREHRWPDRCFTHSLGDLPAFRGNFSSVSQGVGPPLASWYLGSGGHARRSAPARAVAVSSSERWGAVTIGSSGFVF
jgi:hypothetical protein